MPRAERVLWNVLRKKRLCGLRFRRQHPVGPYFLDFFCHSCNLGVELDGSSHDEPEVQHDDRRRDRFLAANGLRVIRFLNRDVLNNLDGVVHAIHLKATGHQWDGVLGD